MAKAWKKLLVKPGLLRTILFFVVSYVLFLVVWLFVKDYYGMAVTTVASHLVTLVNNASVHSIEMKGDLVVVGFAHDVPPGFGALQKVLIPVNVKTLYYTFNVPLTLAVMTAFYPYLNRKRVYLEVVLIIVFIHLLFVFTFEARRIADVVMNAGFEKMSGTKLSLWNYFQAFVGSMVVRFESFLIGVYLYFMRGRGLEATAEK